MSNNNADVNKDGSNATEAKISAAGSGEKLDTDGNEETVEMDVNPANTNSADIKLLEQKLADAQAVSQENLDRALRAQAELENVRRRSQRELENAHKYGLEKFIQDLLPIKDSLEMGIDAAKNAAARQDNTAEIDKLMEGSELILKMFADLLDKYSVETIHPLGEPFDPEHHQAMSMLESPDHAPNTVVMVMQKGYKLNDRLVRPAMVAVAKESSN